MAKKFYVFIDYGISVETADDIDPETEEGYAHIKKQAVEILKSRGIHEIVQNGNLEIEDVSEEFGFN